MDASLRASLLAIDPATVEAGPETDLLVAKCLPRPTICPESWEWGVSRGWSPTKHWEAAMEAAEAYIKRFLPGASFFHAGFGQDGYSCFMRVRDGHHRESAPTGPLCICRAILSAARTEAEAEENIAAHLRGESKPMVDVIEEWKASIPDAAGKVS